MYVVSSSERLPNTFIFQVYGKALFLKNNIFVLSVYVYDMYRLSQTNYRGLEIVFCYTEKRLLKCVICLSARHSKENNAKELVKHKDLVTHVPETKKRLI